jgi:hypothetical protein
MAAPVVSANERWFMEKFYEMDTIPRAELIKQMRDKMATVPESEREACGMYLEGVLLKQ